MTDTSIGFLHPGAMGVSLAASTIASGQRVCWVGANRSAETRSRAEQHGLTELGSLEELCRTCGIIVSICPPTAASDVAASVVQQGFTGIFVDANAISPKRARDIGSLCTGAGMSYVDASVIGGPAWSKDETVLYLSGPQAQLVASRMSGGLLATRVIGDELDRASALKMCYAAFTKGSTAMLCAIVAAAHELGVHDELARQWELDEPGSSERTHQRVRRVTAKAWRYEGEMHEIADTLEAAGLPGGFHAAAAELYARLGDFKGRDAQPELREVVDRLLDA